jgi:penicillin-binding protein 1A
MALAGAPVGIQEVSSASAPLPDGSHVDRNKVETKRVLPTPIAQTETSMLESVIQYGTGRAAAIGQFAAGKTGTTSNFGDAWFVGWDGKYTVAVWVGYPDKLVPMLTDFNGQPVMGGTFPALIWHDFMTAALQIDKNRAEHLAEAKRANGKSAGGEAEAAEERTASTGEGTPGGASGNPSSKANGKSSAPGGAESSAPAPAQSEHSSAPSAPAHETPSAPAPATPASPAEPSSPSPSPTGGVGPGG